MQRVLALEAYTTTTSVSRVVVVCVGSIMPMLSLVLSQELIRLQDPKDRWRANYGFWIRATVVVYVEAYALTVQGASIGAAACSMAVASQLGFLIPFYVLANDSSILRSPSSIISSSSGHSDISPNSGTTRPVDRLLQLCFSSVYGSLHLSRVRGFIPLCRRITTPACSDRDTAFSQKDSETYYADVYQAHGRHGT
ncbi:hypothetical protein JG688_00009472 [Phytophthora aleatoria]|uniref:Uncharacterized protein n=1 Tax=Phytophthora aleatoria TaxID=2496075 RepID=A0A8J5ILB2_9STRA|nr:hypothetical protein JG688_00009472 [Phytophthora aleatoria]